MDLSGVTTKQECSREKIAVYLDGELDPREELMLEKHLASCSTCLSELNLQKQMFSALDSVFDDKAEITLPENFAKVVAIHAETNVKGLRSNDERFRALFFCTVLFLLVMTGLGVETAFDSLGKFGEQVATVISFTGHLTYDLIIGITVVLRSVGNQPEVNSALTVFMMIGVCIIPAVILSRYIESSNRS